MIIPVRCFCKNNCVRQLHGDTNVGRSSVKNPSKRNIRSVCHVATYRRGNCPPEDSTGDMRRY